MRCCAVLGGNVNGYGVSVVAGQCKRRGCVWHVTGQSRVERRENCWGTAEGCGFRNAGAASSHAPTRSSLRDLPQSWGRLETILLEKPAPCTGGVPLPPAPSPLVPRGEGENFTAAGARFCAGTGVYTLSHAVCGRGWVRFTNPGGGTLGLRHRDRTVPSNLPPPRSLWGRVGEGGAAPAPSPRFYRMDLPLTAPSSSPPPSSRCRPTGSAGAGSRSRRAGCCRGSPGAR